MLGCDPLQYGVFQLFKLHIYCTDTDTIVIQFKCRRTIHSLIHSFIASEGVQPNCLLKKKSIEIRLQSKYFTPQCSKMNNAITLSTILKCTLGT